MANKSEVYQEQLFDSMGILIKKQLESLQFDRTIEATIVDDKEASKGIYTVSTGNISFLAYSENTNYKEKDVVMVTIPQGNYDNQKMIIGKKVNKKIESPINYQEPFEQLINITNNIVDISKEAKFSANNENEYCWNINTLDFENSNAFTKKENSEKIALLDSKDVSLYNYSKLTKIGVKADFATWLKEYQVVSGNYGLAVVLKFSHPDYTEENEFITRTVVLDSSEFFGDIYNFEVFSSQEAVFDISELKDYILKNVEIYGYQRNNFIKSNGEKLPYNSELEENISIKNIEVCLGIDSEEFVKDSAEIICANSSNYTNDENLRKILNLRWIHQDDNKIIKVIEEDEVPVGYKVLWYRYRLGAPSPDKFAGAHWDRFYGCKDTANDEKDYCKTFDEVKENNSQETDYSKDLATNHIEKISFYPNVNKEKEMLKVIIVKEKTISVGNINESDYEIIAESPVIEFINNNEIKQKIDLLDANALSIRFDDDERGNYFLYNRAGQVSKSEDTLVRTLTAVFDDTKTNIYEKDPLSIPYTSIKWIFPASNTMITPVITDMSGAAVSNNLYYNENNLPNDTFEFIYNNDNIQNGNIDKPPITVGYQINKQLNHSANRNTVTLEVERLGQTYIASVKMLFGTAGSSGSDYTIVVEWENGENAFDINKGTLTGQIKLLDQAGNEVDLNDDANYTVSWDKWRVIKNNEEVQPAHAIEDKDLYYPIAYILYKDDSYVDKKLLSFDCLYMTNKNGSGYYGDENDNNYPKYYLKGYQKIEYNLDQLAIYDLNQKGFIHKTYDDIKEGQIVYSKKKESINEYKIDFKPCDYIKQNSNPSGILTIDENKKVTYHYDNKRKLFIKFNDTYIVDPWDNYQEGETYYYPVYSEEKNYNSSDKVLRIIPPNSNNKKKFIITDKKNDDDDHSLKPDIDNDLYILKIELKNFGDYPLTASFPIALKNSDENYQSNQTNASFVVDYIEGPAEVRYSTSGEVDFYKNPYLIKYRLLNNNNSYIEENQDAFVTDNNNSIKIGHWELIYDNLSDDSASLFLPELTEFFNNTNHLNNFNLDIIKAAFLAKIKSTDTYYKLNTLIKGFRKKEKINNIYYYYYDENNADNLGIQISQNGKNPIDAFSKLIKRLEDHNYNRSNNGEYKRSFTEAYDSIIPFSPNYNQNSILINSNYQNYNIENILNDNLINKNDFLNFLELLKNSKGMNYTGDLPVDLFTRPLLNPPSIYFKDTPLYGIKFVIDYNIGTNNNNNNLFLNNKNDFTVLEDGSEGIIISKNTTLWTQPIYVYQDNYPSTTLNKWNGKDMVTDDETGIISVNGFSAGKKEENNTFTGVVVGDWSRTDSDAMLSKQTGIYGFNHGVMSYALKDDGTAFFGKDGKGRIYFDGESAQIYSANWTLPELNTTSNLYKQQQQGMMLDIDDGVLWIRGFKDGDTSEDIIDLLKFSKNESLINARNFTLNANKTRTIYDYENETSINANYFVKIDSSGSPFLHIGINTTTGTLDNFFTDESYNKNYLYITQNGGYIHSHNYVPFQKTSQDYTRGPEGLQIDLKNGSIILGDKRYGDSVGARIVGNGYTSYPGNVHGNSQPSAGYGNGRWFEMKVWGTQFLILRNYKYAYQALEDGEHQDVLTIDWKGNLTCQNLICKENLQFVLNNIKYKISSVGAGGIIYAQAVD